MSRKEKLQTMLAKEPGDTFLNYALALELTKEGDDEAALSRFDRVLALDAAYLGAYQQKAHLLIKLERVDEARAELERGIQAAVAAHESHAEEELRGLLSSLGKA